MTLPVFTCTKKWSNEGKEEGSESSRKDNMAEEEMEEGWRSKRLKREAEGIKIDGRVGGNGTENKEKK